MILKIISTLSLLVLSSTQADQIISTSFGDVQGNTALSRDGRTFYQFLGIPYAKAERFLPPTDPEAWKDVRDATQQGSVCPQIKVDFDDSAPKIFLGSEDCLNLNVFSPKLPQANQAKVLLPVMVWFHGGGDIDGAMNYDPQYFMDTDIVVVTFNARLGFLGFLNLGNELASGNQRLKDQVLMLKWVQKNIENFGGDPSRVTLNGVDTGAADLSYHFFSPMSKGLFAGAIAQNGSPLVPLFIRNPIYQAKRFGTQVGCPVETKEGLLECLNGKRPEDLVLSFHRWISDITETEFLKVGASIEYIDPEKAFLTDSPFVLLKEGRLANKVPWIMTFSVNAGYTVFSAKILANKSLQKKLNDNIKTMLPRYLDYDNTASDPDAVTQKIIDNYFDGGEITESNILVLIHLVSYRFFSGPSLHTGEFYPDHASAYMLVDRYVATASCPSLFGYEGILEGACTEDVSYQFPWTNYYPGINKTSKDYPLSKKLVELYASFFEMGKPTKTWGEVQKWLPYDTTQKFGVSIDRDGGMGTHTLTPEYVKSFPFWRALLKNELASELENPVHETF